MISVESPGRMAMGTAMREFALEGLHVPGDEEETRLRHAEHYDAVVVASEPLLEGRKKRDGGQAVPRLAKPALGRRLGGEQRPRCSWPALSTFAPGSWPGRATTGTTSRLTPPG